jgi:multimeric flavodoxin WrbA
MSNKAPGVRVLGLAASPRRGGNSETLLDRFLAGAHRTGAATEKVVLPELRSSDCRACYACDATGACIVDDGWQSLNERLIAADVIALSSPVFFAGLPAGAKAVVDRAQCQWVRKFRLHRPLAPTASGRSRRRGILVAVGGDPRTRFEGIKKTVKYFFDVYETDYWEDLLLPGIDEKGAIEDHPDALAAAFALGERAAGPI